MRLYAYLDHDNGCLYHRHLLPCRHLRADFPQHQFSVSVQTDPAGRYDAYSLHGLLHTRNYTEVGRWKRDGGVFVWSLDDAFPDCPDWNPARPDENALASWYVARDVADVIAVTTPALAARVGRPEKTVVAPNLLDVAVYKTPTPAPEDDGVIRVLWGGSQTHSGDLEQVVRPVRHVVAKYPGRVEFVFFGFCPDELLTTSHHNGVHYQAGVPLSVYGAYLSTVRPSIVLAPLADIAFNHAKSNIRCLEGFALSAATVASPVGEYRVVRDGVDGLLAADEDAWVDRLERLIEDEGLRRRLGAEGRRRVCAEFDWASPVARRQWHPYVDRVAALCGD